LSTSGLNVQAGDRGCWCPELKGKTAIITGAGGARGLGKDIALELARQGVNVVLTDISPPGAAPAQGDGWQGVASVAALVEAAGAAALPLVSDITDPQSVDAVVAGTIERFGGIDFLVNNAGAAVAGDRVPVTDMPLAEWNRVLGVNLNGSFLMSRAVGKAMIERGQGGAIVNISSIASRQAAPRNAAYAVSKAALNTLSRVMAMELGPHRIRVNTIMPGLTLTSRLGNLPESEGWDAFVKNYVPLGFAGAANEIAYMCTYLCSDMGKWISGQDIAVDGGSSWR
jgi:3-oxoacyl-[acyl-carrier protein] reductase/meso-butanediol dehydrogenase/(S,S)-butanediol dehydrogenase/diacetyl reductase